MPEPRTTDTRPHDPPGEAVRRLFEEHADRIYALAVRFCGNATDAEDLVQEVFLQAARKWHTFRGESRPETWLYTIAARACQRMHRPRAGQPGAIGSLDEDLPFSNPRIASEPGALDDQLQHQVRLEARRRLESAIATLPDEFRVPLILKDIAGFSVNEVSAILGVAEGTIRSRVHRARLKLRAGVDGAIPRAPGDAPEPAYDRQTCLDLLDAKQEALDRGVPFDATVVCQRCRSVFASLDLTKEVCADIASDRIPADVRQRLRESLASA